MGTSTRSAYALDAAEVQRLGAGARAGARVAAGTHRTDGAVDATRLGLMPNEALVVRFTRPGAASRRVAR